MEYENKHGLKRTIRGAVRVAMAIAGGAFGEKYKQPKFIENSAAGFFVPEAYPNGR